jgi:phosphoserine phosphatase RsbU/P
MTPPQRSKIRFRERAELLDFLLDVAAVTTETLELDSLLSNVGDIVANVIPHDLFALLLYNEKKHVLRIRHARGHREEVIRNLSIGLDEGLTGLAAATREPVLVDDVRSEPRYLNALDAVKSELAVPMITRNKLVGVIDLQSTTTAAFSQQDRALLMLIASRIAVSIDNARLYRRVERKNRIQRLLNQLAQEFSSILEPDELLNKIATTIRSLMNYDGFSVLLLDEQEDTLRHRFSLRFDERVRVDSVAVGQGLTGVAAQTRRAVVARDTAEDPRYIEVHKGIRSEVAIPLIAKDRVIGVLDLESERIGYFTEDHLRMLTTIAPQIAISLENARLYQEIAARERKMDADLSAARELQALLLPRTGPTVPGLQVGIGARAANQVSGDIYDFFQYDDEHTLFAFGDSSGKGAAAALYGALVSGLLRTLSHRRKNPATILSSLNTILMERHVDARYVTLMLLQWHGHSRTFTVANAGSTPPLICRRGEIIRPYPSGVPLGLLEEQQYEESEIVLEPGDVLTLYSDGVQDQNSPSGQDYGQHRLPELLAMIYKEPPQTIVDLIVRDLDNYRGQTPIADDQTLLVLRVD